MVSAIRALQGQMPDLGARNLSLKELDHEFMQKTFSASHKNTDKNLGRPLPAVFTGMLGVSLEVHQGLVSWPVKRVRELRSDRETLICN